MGNVVLSISGSGRWRSLQSLTLDEAYNRYMRAALGSKSASDVTSGLAERWSADNAGTSKLKAVVSAANDGTIAGGQIIQL